MIKGVHALFYTTDADGARASIRDKLGFPFTDAGGGWLIFDAPAGDIGCHPSDRAYHGISFYCDDIDATVVELKAKGVTMAPIREEEWGRVTEFELPGGGPVELYEPKYAKG
jgi:catechol 2,3-dioxygenase-like lactoylglutathione lyase family enzyme